MKKIIVHTIHVQKLGQKIQFQIRLPRNAKKVTGIKITTHGQGS